jgi:molybdopterin-guanine dinucleotide biosynthesis protein A
MPPLEPRDSLEIEASRREVTALILAGGRALRLGGVDKCALLVGASTLLDRRISSLSPLVREILIVGGSPAGAAAGPAAAGVAVRIVRDEPGCIGPLAGLSAGIQASGTPWVFATACDMPFLSTRLYARLWADRGDHDAVVPAVRGWYEPLFAFYHTRCLAAVLEAGRDDGAKLASFFPQIRARFVEAAALREHDPELLSFLNVNTPEELARARAMLAGGELTRERSPAPP